MRACDTQSHPLPPKRDLHEHDMGNVQSGSTLTRTSGALDAFVAELTPDIVYEKRCVGCSLAFVQSRPTASARPAFSRRSGAATAMAPSS